MRNAESSTAVFSCSPSLVKAQSGEGEVLFLSGLHLQIAYILGVSYMFDAPLLNGSYRRLLYVNLTVQNAVIGFVHGWEPG